jgi:hypothetical protein
MLFLCRSHEEAAFLYAQLTRDGGQPKIRVGKTRYILVCSDFSPSKERKAVRATLSRFYGSEND